MCVHHVKATTWWVIDPGYEQTYPKFKTGISEAPQQELVPFKSVIKNAVKL